MANVKWSAFPSGTTISGSDIAVGLQSGADVQWPFSALATYITGALTVTGSGSYVRATSPTLVTPTLGVATATSVNKMAITAPATSSTLAVADGKTATISNTLTFTGTDSSSVAFGTGGTATYTSNNLSVFAATTSAQLAGVISDETGSGALVFGTSPTISGANLGTAIVTFGGATTSFPALKRSSAVLQGRLADDSDFCAVQGKLTTAANAVTGLVAGALAALTSASIVIYDATGTAYRVPCVTP